MVVQIWTSISILVGLEDSAIRLKSSATSFVVEIPLQTSLPVIKVHHTFCFLTDVMILSLS